MTKILVVEDNQDMRRGLQQFLEREGYTTDGVASCEDGIDAVDDTAYDGAIIDINLPGKSGFAMIEYIREEGHTFPLIAMTARDGIDDKLKGFELGLTDYIVKPFDLKELLARLHTHVRSSTMNTDETIKTANFTIKPQSYEFRSGQEKIGLTQLEFKMMHLFMQNNHSMVALDDLIEFVWGESDDLVSPPVRIHIANLRKKIGDTTYQIIRTIPGVGYVFNDPLERMK